MNSTAQLIGDQALLLEKDVTSMNSAIPSVINAQATSPIKKPIGAERTINTYRSNSSISPPLIKSSTPAPLSTLVPTIQTTSTLNITTPAKPISIQLPSSKISLSAFGGKKSAPIILPGLMSIESTLNSSDDQMIALKAIDTPFASTQQPNQMIRESPQHNSISQASPQQQQSSNFITEQQQIDQLNKLKQIQQLQRQQQQQQLSQQQVIVNNLISLLNSNNSNIDSQQLSSILLQMNQLLNSNQNNSHESSFQPNVTNIHQHKLNETNNMLKNLLQLQQQKQPSVFLPNQTTNLWVTTN